MKEIFKTWNKFLTEVRAGSAQEVVSLISSGEKVLINVDKPMGTSKTFGGKEENKVQLPFDYGEWKEIINPSDNMGWDFIIVPSKNKNTLCHSSTIFSIVLFLINALYLVR